MAIKDIVDILRKLRDSDDSNDQDIFCCIIHAVIAETTFFKEYPLEALATTSVLFGSMILFDLLRGFVLDVAFQIIYTFASESPDSKMFKFAVQALYAFRMRLNEYSPFCKRLLDEIPGLQTQPQIQQILTESAANPNVSIPEQKAPALVELNYFNINEVISPVTQEVPPREVTEAILFNVNNITMSNFDTKIVELKALLEEKYYQWFSNYLVNQRSKTEPNYHPLYAKMLKIIDSKTLHAYMLNFTYKQLFIMLSTKELGQTEKTHMKNLSSWLGSITLSLDIPIKHKHIAFRELLLDAHKNDRLTVVIPFVARIIMQSKDSKVFCPPNPWTCLLYTSRCV